MGSSQHTVPQTYLKAFVDKNSEYPESNAIWYFDKSTQLIKQKGVKNFLEKNHFYSFTYENGKKDERIEKYLSFIESKFSTIMKRLEKINFDDSNSVKEISLSFEERIILSHYTIWQYKRTFRQLKQLETGYINELRKDNIQPEMELTGEVSAFEKNHILWIMTQLGESKNMNFTRILVKRNIMFTIIPSLTKSGFIASDNPVLITNSQEPAGLIKNETEISMPLSPKLAISFYHFGNKIQYRYIIRDKKLIRNINKSIFKNADRYVVGPSQKQLEYLSKNTII